MALHVEACPGGEAVARQASEFVAGQPRTGPTACGDCGPETARSPPGRDCAANATMVADEAAAGVGA
jgi:hypothetical protein